MKLRKRKMQNDLSVIIMFAGFIIPLMLLVAYFLYDQKKQREKKGQG